MISLEDFAALSKADQTEVLLRLEKEAATLGSHFLNLMTTLVNANTKPEFEMYSVVVGMGYALGSILMSSIRDLPEAELEEKTAKHIEHIQFAIGEGIGLFARQLVLAEIAQANQKAASDVPENE